MTIFFSSSPYNLGSATCLVGCGTVYGENQSVYDLLKDRGAKITEPVVDVLKSKQIPRVLVPWGKKELLLKGVKGVEVPLEYMSVLFWLMKKEYYIALHEATDEGLKKMDAAIKYRINQLLVSGKLLDADAVVGRSERDIYEIEKLHGKLKKFDRGRRSYLNFSSQQSEEDLEKDRLLRKAHSSQKHEKELTPFEPLDFREDAPVEATEEAPIFTDKPWLR